MSAYWSGRLRTLSTMAPGRDHSSILGKGSDWVSWIKNRSEFRFFASSPLAEIRKVNLRDMEIRLVGKIWQSGVSFHQRGVPMPTRNVNLTPELDAFVAARVESGRFANASEVVRNGLRLLEERELENHAKLIALRQAIDEADASDDADEDLFDQLDAYIDEITSGERQCLPTP